MIPTRLSQRTLALIALAPITVILAILFLAIPWLKSIPDAIAFAIIIPIGVAIIAWGLFIAALGARNEDEVQRASGRFSVTYGFIGGSVLTALLLLFPPFSDFIIATANGIATAIDGDMEKAPVLGFVGGVLTLTLTTAVSSVAVGLYWWRFKR